MIIVRKLLTLLYVIGLVGCHTYDHNKVSILFYSNGEIKEKDSLKDGKKNGSSIKFFEDGKVESLFIYINDTLNGNFYRNYKNGKICQKGNWKNGKLDGVSLLLSENGDTIKNDTWVEGKTVFSVAYDSNGRRFAVINYEKRIRIVFKDTGVVINPL